MMHVWLEQRIGSRDRLDRRRLGLVLPALIGLTGLIAPGFAHGLMAQRCAMWIVIAAVVLSIAAIAITVWALWLVLAVLVGSMLDAGRRYRRLRGQIQWSAIHALSSFAAGLVLALGVRTFVVEAFRIPSSSMSPTLHVGDHMFVNQLAPRWRSPERGEVVVFRQPCTPDRDYVMRVIGLANDTVALRCGVVHVNGAASPTTLERAADSYAEHDESSDRWFERAASRYRESLGGRTYRVFQDPDRAGARRAARRGRRQRRRQGLSRRLAAELCGAGRRRRSASDRPAPWRGRDHQAAGRSVQAVSPLRGARRPRVRPGGSAVELQ
jgi:signal peptidase I